MDTQGKSWHKEYRCTCGKLLFKGLLIDSEVEIKCKGCHALVTLKGVDVNTLICHKEGCPNRI